jgi:hypothetical protein
MASVVVILRLLVVAAQLPGVGAVIKHKHRLSVSDFQRCFVSGSFHVL